MKTIRVAVGVLTDSAGRIFIQRRSRGSHQGGLWEFPGGKVEADESVRDALNRELREEVGIEVVYAEVLMSIDHDYGDRMVNLTVYRVRTWQGSAQPSEGQPIAWVEAGILADFAFPEANAAIVEHLKQNPFTEGV